jgi:hypothetical protein
VVIRQAGFKCGRNLRRRFGCLQCRAGPEDGEVREDREACQSADQTGAASCNAQSPASKGVEPLCEVRHIYALHRYLAFIRYTDILQNIRQTNI